MDFKEAVERLPQAWLDFLHADRVQGGGGYQPETSSVEGSMRAFLGRMLPSTEPVFPMVYGWQIAEQTWNQWSEPEMVGLFLRRDQRFEARDLFMIGDTDPDFPFAINLKQAGDDRVWYFDLSKRFWAASALKIGELLWRMRQSDWTAERD